MKGNPTTKNRKAPTPNRPALFGRGGAFRSIDFGIGLAAGGSIFVAEAALDLHLECEGVQILLALAALGVALLAVALTALAILVGLMSQEYLRLLERAEGGDVRNVFLPYRVVSVVGAGVVGVALVSILLWNVQGPLPLSFETGRAFGVSLTVTCAVWGLVGTVQLVNITSEHGFHRAEWIKLIAEARRGALKRDRVGGQLKNKADEPGSEESAQSTR